LCSVLGDQREEVDLERVKPENGSSAFRIQLYQNKKQP